ncbi:hypothetical protein KTS45_14370 [Halomicroarcula limicola]|uniref:Uncharacterized protein n=1 Tax=Haloarcula limicola TaxID=1429915 RepID=A0A8J7YF83_9EURY|nr:hypothetical protein [Halomicroarcula limicola]
MVHQCPQCRTRVLRRAVDGWTCLRCGHVPYHGAD